MVQCSPRAGRWLRTDISVHTWLLWVSMAPSPISQAKQEQSVSHPLLYPEKTALKGQTPLSSSPRQIVPLVKPCLLEKKLSSYPLVKLLPLHLSSLCYPHQVHHTKTASSPLWHSRLSATLTQSTTVAQQRRHFPIRSVVVLSSTHSIS